MNTNCKTHTRTEKTLKIPKQFLISVRLCLNEFRRFYYYYYYYEYTRLVSSFIIFGVVVARRVLCVRCSNKIIFIYSLYIWFITDGVGEPESWAMVRREFSTNNNTVFLYSFDGNKMRRKIHNRRPGTYRNRRRAVSAPAGKTPQHTIFLELFSFRMGRNEIGSWRVAGERWDARARNGSNVKSLQRLEFDVMCTCKHGAWAHASALTAANIMRWK